MSYRLMFEDMRLRVVLNLYIKGIYTEQKKIKFSLFRSKTTQHNTDTFLWKYVSIKATCLTKQRYAMVSKLIRLK